MPNPIIHPEQRHREAAAELIEAYWQGAGDDVTAMRKLAQRYRDGHSHGVWVYAFARFERDHLTQVEAMRGALERLTHANGPIVIDWWGEELAWRPLDYGTWTPLTPEATS